MKKLLFVITVLLVFAICGLVYCVVQIKMRDQEILVERVRCAMCALSVIHQIRDVALPSEMNRWRRVVVAANLDRLNSICLASEQAVEKVLQAPLAREVIAYSLKVVDEREPWCVLSVKAGDLVVEERTVTYTALHALLLRIPEDAGCNKPIGDL